MNAPQGDESRSSSSAPSSFSEHLRRVESVRESLGQWHKQRLPGQKLTLVRGTPEQSNTVRNAGYKAGHFGLDVSSLNHVVNVDTQTMRMQVEPGVSMDGLFHAAFAHGVVPRVLPEFRKLTVGGLIQGAGLESGSFRVGQFNDQAHAYTVVLANGDLLTLDSDGPHRDLFYAQTGSFGSLAVLVSASLEVTRATSHVAVTYERASSFDEAVEALSAYSERGDHDYLEGIVFSPHKAAIIRGKRVDGAQGFPEQRFQTYGSRWFYEHADDVTREQSSHEERVPLRDYLFRYDQGAFWTGAYARWKGIPIGEMRLLRRLLHPAFSTEALYRRLHRRTEEERARRFVVQDCYIPASHTAQFLRVADQSLGIYPVWLCPLKTTQTPQKLSPHWLPSALCINVGLYGRPSEREFDPRVLNRQLEAAILASGGRKMLYAHAYYTPEEFWAMHDRPWYEGLREKYGARDVLLSVEEKVLRQG